MKVRPIKPSEVVKNRESYLPEAVLVVFNSQIEQKWDGYSAVLLQEEVAEEIASRLGLTTEDVFARHYLEVEDLYRKSGWVVEYDKPAYNESYPATFTFRVKS